MQKNDYISKENGMAERVGFEPDQPKKFPSLLIKLTPFVVKESGSDSSNCFPINDEKSATSAFGRCLRKT